MVFNATFNNISVASILLMEETGDSREITTMNMKEKIKIFY